jgi:hypothetical protein
VTSKPQDKQTPLDDLTFPTGLSQPSLGKYPREYKFPGMRTVRPHVKTLEGGTYQPLQNIKYKMDDGRPHVMKLGRETPWKRKSHEPATKFLHSKKIETRDEPKFVLSVVLYGISRKGFKQKIRGWLWGIIR